jgi:hypothetical protein
LFVNKKFLWRDYCLGSGRLGGLPARWREKDE